MKITHTENPVYDDMQFEWSQAVGPFETHIFHVFSGACIKNKWIGNIWMFWFIVNIFDGKKRRTEMYKCECEKVYSIQIYVYKGS